MVELFSSSQRCKERSWSWGVEPIFYTDPNTQSVEKNADFNRITQNCCCCPVAVSVLFNLLPVWISFWNTHSRLCFRIFSVSFSFFLSNVYTGKAFCAELCVGTGYPVYAWPSQDRCESCWTPSKGRIGRSSHSSHVIWWSFLRSDNSGSMRFLFFKNCSRTLGEWWVVFLVQRRQVAKCSCCYLPEWQVAFLVCYMWVAICILLEECLECPGSNTRWWWCIIITAAPAKILLFLKAQDLLWHQVLVSQQVLGFFSFLFV